MILDFVEFHDAKIRLSTESDLRKIRKEFADLRESEREREGDSGIRIRELKNARASQPCDGRFSYSRQPIRLRRIRGLEMRTKLLANVVIRVTGNKSARVSPFLHLLVTPGNTRRVSLYYLACTYGSACSVSFTYRNNTE